MLVLARGQNQKVHIGKDITVTVLRISPKSIRLGFDAPNDMEILRDEQVNKDVGNEADKAA